MPYRYQRKPRRKLMLFPLMDMFFILLIFFLVTSGFSPVPPEQRGAFNNVPRMAVGEAQILIQVVNESEVFWLDNTSFDGAWRNDFYAANRVPMQVETLRERLLQWYESVGMCVGEEVLVVVRAPHDLPFRAVVNLQESLRNLFESNLARFDVVFSLLPGSLQDIEIEGIESGQAEVRILWQNVG